VLGAVVPAFAQDTASVPVVGVLRIDTTANLAPFARMLRDAFAALGYVDGKNLRLDFRLTEGDTKRLPELAEALVREKVSVIYAAGPAAARAAQGATRTIPIVATGSDLVALGLITSLAKPGGNITGVSLLIPELDAKRLEVLKEIVPSGQRFGLISDPATNGSTGSAWNFGLPSRKTRPRRSPPLFRRDPRLATASGHSQRTFFVARSRSGIFHG
jgi:putative tryptophan/tyrosine transport system substrate-binding protein